MKCERLTLPGGIAGFICGPSRRYLARCQQPGCTAGGERQCDFPVGDGKTCDKHLCADHAARQGRGRDYCPDHPGQGDLFAGAGL